MLDFDSEGEGAADLQVHTGKIRVSVGAGILACLEDSVTKENAKRYVQHARHPYSLLNFLQFLERILFRFLLLRD
jgi:hypothetical protein